MSKKEIDRRGFLQYAGIGLAALSTGCHGALYKHMRQDCPQSRNLEETIRVMAYNIANARGNYDDLFKLRPKDVIEGNLRTIGKMCRYEGIDLLCMNEVDFDSARTHHIDQAEAIAKHLCFNHVIKERMFSLPGIIDVGNAVVSRYPLKLNSYQQYGGDYLGCRIKNIFKSYVDFDVDLGNGRTLNVVLTHLDHISKKTRKEQIDTLMAHLKKKTRPFILLGDFNSGPGYPNFDRLMQSGLVHNSKVGIPTFRSDRPKDSKDHILVSPELGIKNYHAVWAEMSDHRPVVGDVILTQSYGRR